jgi:hypothetical protein
MRIADYELCRHGGDGAGGAAVLGASLGAERNQVIVTVEKEGVLCYDVSTQVRLNTSYTQRDTCFLGFKMTCA